MHRLYCSYRAVPPSSVQPVLMVTEVGRPGTGPIRRSSGKRDGIPEIGLFVIRPVVSRPDTDPAVGPQTGWSRPSHVMPTISGDLRRIGDPRIGRAETDLF